MKTRTLAIATVLTAVLTIAAAPAAPGTAGKNCPNGMGRQGERPERVCPDTNNDCIVDDTEAAAAADRMIERISTGLERMRSCCDKNGDGVIDEKEMGKVLDRLEKRREQRAKHRGNRGQEMGPIDANQDLVLSDAEAAAARERLLAMFQKRNVMVMKRFDADKNGALDEAEQSAAREAREKIKNGIKGRGRNGRGGPNTANAE